MTAQPTTALADLSLVAGLSEASCAALPLARWVREGAGAVAAHVTLVEFFSGRDSPLAPALTRVARAWHDALPEPALAALLPLDFRTGRTVTDARGSRVEVQPATPGDARRLAEIARRATSLARPVWMPAPTRPPLHVTLAREPGDEPAVVAPGSTVRCDALHLAVATALPYGGIVHQVTYRPMAGYPTATGSS
ncbi:hypothetical protein [Micromonospora vulcania]|uniref:2'-5' RNA ligase superfamily protein n=1 Tax=Micromonospora vulcania TaxID=1441873 RepID=A0ABW1H2U8_9ACTN